MPIEPPQTPWRFPSAEEADPTGLVGVGADHEPGTILTAYRSGLFPMPVEPEGHLGWWSPDPRGVLELDDLHVSRSLARSMLHFEFRVNTAFEAVVAGCADPARPHGWIDARVTAAYRRLHELGWCHSIETWRDGELVGGLYGIAIGGLFAAESKFHRVSDASKAALVALVDGFRDKDRRLIDVQWSTPHLATLGATDLSRSTYVAQLPALLDSPPSMLFAGEPRTIAVAPRA